MLPASRRFFLDNRRGNDVSSFREAEDLAFLAMTCHRLGDREQARNYLDKRRALGKQTRARSAEFAALLREAEEVLGGR